MSRLSPRLRVHPPGLRRNFCPSVVGNPTTGILGPRRWAQIFESVCYLSLEWLVVMKSFCGRGLGALAVLSSGSHEAKYR